jgi:tetratricopeptide (TPR) repeat protein
VQSKYIEDPGERAAYTEKQMALFPDFGTAPLSPKFGVNWVHVAGLWMEAGQYQKAIVAYKKSFDPSLTELYPEWAAQARISEAYEAFGQFGSAISARKRSIELKPDDSGSYAHLASLYYKNKQYDETIPAARRALELRSNNDVAYSYLGAAYGEKKQYAEAMKAFRASIEINPKDPSDYRKMGGVYMVQGAYDEAIIAFKKGIEVAPQNLALHDGLALSYYCLGRYDEAISSINTAIDLATFTDGVGIKFQIQDGYPVVSAIEDSGPAKRADIGVGDKIWGIDEDRMQGWDSERVAKKLGGAIGTQVSLLIIKPTGSRSTITKTVTREKILSTGTAPYIGIRSLIYRQKGEFAKAFDDATLASSLRPSDKRGIMALAAARHDQGQYAEAAKELSQVKDSSIARRGKTQEAIGTYFSINRVVSKKYPPGK